MRWTAVQVSGYVFENHELFQHTEFHNENILRYGLHVRKLDALALTSKSEIIRYAKYWLQKYNPIEQ
jgi:hypothetical protein